MSESLEEWAARRDAALADFRRALKGTREYRALERFVAWLARKLVRN